MTINHIFTRSISLLVAERDSSPDHVKHRPERRQPVLASPSVRAPPSRTSSTSLLQLGSSRSHLQLEPLLQERGQPVYTPVGLVSYSPSVGAYPESGQPVYTPIGVVSFSPSVRAPPPRTSCAGSRPAAKILSRHGKAARHDVQIPECRFLQDLDCLLLETVSLFTFALSS